MATFPGDMVLLLVGHSERSQPNVRRTQTESGYVIQKRFASSDRRIVSCATIIDDDDKADFDTWLESGALNFFTFNYDGADRQMRLVGGSWTNTKVALTKWRYTMQLEYYR